MDLSVIIPVYNGAGFVAESVGDLSRFLGRRRVSYEIVAVDDGSSDRTAHVLRGLASERVRLVSYDVNRGKYGALKVGMRHATGTCKVFTDADVPFEHEALLYIEHLINEKQFHMAIGDRTLVGAVYAEELPLVRNVATRVFRTIIRLVFTGGLADTQCGIKGFRSDIADEMFPMVTEDGFAGDVELLYIALKYNLAIRRIPVRLRRAGPSTVNAWQHAGTMLAALARLRRNWGQGVYDSESLFAVTSQFYWDNPHIGQ